MRKQAPPSTRRRDIQGLRAVAVLMVVAFHARLPASGGFVGVDVFFVISGFVITQMLKREWNTNGRIDFGNFFARRFQRLAPALALTVATTVALSAALLSPVSTQPEVAARTGIAAMFFVANAAIALDHNSYFDPEAVRNPLLHTWSLSVEEQFYLVFPALIAIAWHVGRRTGARITPYLLVAIVSVVSFWLPSAMQRAATATATPEGGLIGPLLGFYSPVTRFWEFGAGALLALASRRLIAQPRFLAIASGLAGAILICASAFTITESTPFPSRWSLVPILGTVLTLAAGSHPANPISRILSLPPMVKLGDWSYSIYLWHWPFILFAATIWSPSRRILVAAAALSVLPAIASYYRVELPIRSIRNFHGRSARRLAGLTTSIPVAVCVSILFANNAGYWSEGIRTMQRTVRAHHATDMSQTRCFIDTGTPQARQDSVKPCLFNSEARGNPIYLVGDSTAWHFAEAAIGAGKLLGRPVEIVWLPGCPFKDIMLHSENKLKNTTCRRGYEATMRWLATAPAGTVIVSEINTKYATRRVEAGPGGSTSGRSPTQVQDTGLISMIESLEDAGHSIILAQAVPRFAPAFDPLKCSWSDLRTNTCTRQMSLDEANSIQGAERTSLRRIAAQTGVGLWDPRELFCPDQTCRTQSDDVNLYIDSQHITPEASRLLATSLAETIREDDRAP